LEQLKTLPNEFDFPILDVMHDRAAAIKRGKIMRRGKPKAL